MCLVLVLFNSISSVDTHEEVSAHGPVVLDSKGPLYAFEEFVLCHPGPLLVGEEVGADRNVQCIPSLDEVSTYP